MPSPSPSPWPPSSIGACSEIAPFPTAPEPVAEALPERFAAVGPSSRTTLRAACTMSWRMLWKACAAVSRMDAVERFAQTVDQAGELCLDVGQGLALLVTQVLTLHQAVQP